MQRLIRHRCERLGLPPPVFEHRFHPTRRWRWDVAFIDQKVALEVDGGVWNRGAHGRGTGIVRDQEKANAGVTLGWRIVRCTPREVEQMAIWATLRELLLAPAGRGDG